AVRSGRTDKAKDNGCQHSLPGYGCRRGGVGPRDLLRHSHHRPRNPARQCRRVAGHFQTVEATETGGGRAKNPTLLENITRYDPATRFPALAPLMAVTIDLAHRTHPKSFRVAS